MFLVVRLKTPRCNKKSNYRVLLKVKLVPLILLVPSRHSLALCKYFYFGIATVVGKQFNQNIRDVRNGEEKRIRALISSYRGAIVVMRTVIDDLSVT